MLTISTRTGIYLLVLINLFVILFCWMGFDGFNFTDDWEYISAAIEVTEGRYVHKHTNFYGRWGIIFPLAAFISLGGVNDAVIIALPLVATLITINTVYFALKSLNQSWALWASFFMAMDFYSLWFTKMVYPDTLITTYVILALTFLFRNLFLPSSNTSVNAILFSLFLFAAFITKLTVILIGPFILIVLINDLINKKNGRFWKISIALSVVLLTAYFHYYHSYHGNALGRFQWQQDTHVPMHSNYYHKPFIHTLKRITYEPFFMFMTIGTIIPLLFSLPSLAKSIKTSFLRVTTPETYWTIALFSSLLTVWFMSTSIRFYNPLGLEGRHFLLFAPLLAICGAKGWLIALKEEKWMLWLTFGLLSIFILSIHFWMGKITLIYGFLLVVVPAFRFFTSAIRKQWLMIAFIAIFLIHPVYSMFNLPQNGYRELQLLLKNELSESALGEAVVYCHPHEIQVIHWINKDFSDSLSFLPYDYLKSDNAEPSVFFVLVNKGYEKITPYRSYKNSSMELKLEMFSREEIFESGNHVLYEFK